MELKHYLSILRRWGWIMVLCTVLASVASFLFSSQQPQRIVQRESARCTRTK